MKKEKIIEELMEEKSRLANIIREARKRLEKAPEGSVRIVKHKKHVQFYERREASDTSGTYIPASECGKAVALMQKKYDMQIAAAAEKQFLTIDRFLKKYDPEVLKTIYRSQSEVRKANIIPAELPDQEYMENWQSCEYEAKTFAEGFPEHFTSKGERVRSKSEAMIADSLNQAGIAYRYECPLELGGRIIHPDFTVLRSGDRETLYWEHLGMMDDAEYCCNAMQRIRLYETNGIYPGINLILTMATRVMPVNISVINRMVRTYCV